MIEKREINIAREIDDVFVLVIEVIKVVRNGGEYTNLIDELINAVNGIDDIPEELKDLKAVINTVGVRVGDIVEAFAKKPE